MLGEHKTKSSIHLIIDNHPLSTEAKLNLFTISELSDWIEWLLHPLHRIAGEELHSHFNKSYAFAFNCDILVLRTNDGIKSVDNTFR